jgi:hypothetical protein
MGLKVLSVGEFQAFPFKGEDLGRRGHFEQLSRIIEPGGDLQNGDQD